MGSTTNAANRSANFAGAVEFVAMQEDARKLQYSMLTIFAFCYGCSGLLFVYTYRHMKSNDVGQ
jgi:hypothetical protein